MAAVKKVKKEIKEDVNVLKEDVKKDVPVEDVKEDNLETDTVKEPTEIVTVDSGEDSITVDTSEKPSGKMVKIKPNCDSRFFYGTTWYVLKKDIITLVPDEVKTRLQEAGKLSAL